ncbi:hypothetical protein GCM10007422_07300 [Pedobacter zeae]|uniref:Uncharacterized protein n=1 Tax=Pedobacter zeae TaxID=1737356 RepID=A0ABQ1XKH3_9SPHI|nr:hypothetical protein GCM10007422_07300 [Pedobacter zeae]
MQKRIRIYFKKRRINSTIQTHFSENQPDVIKKIFVNFANLSTIVTNYDFLQPGQLISEND